MPKIKNTLPNSQIDDEQQPYETKTPSGETSQDEICRRADVEPTSGNSNAIWSSIRIVDNPYVRKCTLKVS